MRQKRNDEQNVLKIYLARLRSEWPAPWPLGCLGCLGCPSCFLPWVSGLSVFPGLCGFDRQLLIGHILCGRLKTVFSLFYSCFICIPWATSAVASWRFFKRKILFRRSSGRKMKILFGTRAFWPCSTRCVYVTLRLNGHIYIHMYVFTVRGEIMFYFKLECMEKVDWK